MLNWSEITAAADNEPPPFSIQLSEQSKILILHLLGFAAEGWPIAAELSDRDARDAAVSLAIDEVLTPVAGGGDVQLIGELSGIAAAYEFENLPTIYNNMVAKFAFQTNSAGSTDTVIMRINDISTADYYTAVRRFAYENYSIFANMTNGQTFAQMFAVASTAAGVSQWPTLGLLDLYRVGATDVIKQWQYKGALRWGAAESGVQEFSGAGWLDDLAAIEAISFTPSVGTQFTAESYVRLYGVL